MSPFFAGALGALAVLFTLAVVRFAFWRLHFRRLHGRRLPLRFLYRRLGTRPEQERVISQEAEALATELRALRADLRSVRGEVADLLDAPSLDPAALQGAIDGHLARLGDLRARLAETLAKVHATLDPAQRATLAELVRRGPHGHGRCAHGHA